MRRLPLLALVAVAGCLAPAPSEGGVQLQGAAPADPATDFTVAIFDGAFQHERLELVGPAIVRFWNVGNVTHRVVSPDERFPESDPIFPLEEHALRFVTPGEYAFACRYHGEMRGVLVVS